MNFYQMWHTLDQENLPQYHFLDYAKELTNSKVGGHELTPLTDEDMMRYSADDVEAEYLKMHDTNPLRLGEPLDDEGMKKYMGL